ncbi:MAG: serine/threonine protein kinase [Planctomycetes bacterium]|nr:serine/threonine protein kinase [Planctomycetota bacterium]
MLGERLGNWVIFKELGRGGMGRVFLAQEELTGKQAAIKILAGELAQEVGFLHRFQREIDTLSKLDHPNIVRFIESGLENGHYYYAMEYVEGQSLDDILLNNGKMPWREVLDVAVQICPALRHVHDHGIIHRDIKPPNILRTSQGVVKLTDFGIAKVFASSHLTATGGVVGTAEFLSPEQAAGKPVTKRSDIYSLGVVLYTLLTGRTPFVGNSFLDLLHKHRYAQFDPPRKLVPDIPYELDEVVCQLLAKEPDKRPPDCMVLGKQFDSIRRKLDRKDMQTSAGVARDVTVAENRPEDVVAEEHVGPATLMSKLVRAELDRQIKGGPLTQLFNRTWVIVPLLALCVGVMVWTFWPMGMDTLYARGADLMAHDSLRDMEEGWRDYLEPLNSRFPHHPYKAQVEQLRLKLEAARAPGPSEAQRFYQQGETLLKEGKFQDARRVWQNVVMAFGGVTAESTWVGRSEQALAELEKNGAATDRWKSVSASLDRADELRDQGKRAEAEAIWNGLEQLYQNDPWADGLRQKIAAARAK